MRDEHVTPDQSKTIRLHEDFIPVHRYPEGVEFGHHELGAFIKEGVIYKRFFYA
jgi:hypothetical protein